MFLEKLICNSGTAPDPVYLHMIFQSKLTICHHQHVILEGKHVDPVSMFW